MDEMAVNKLGRRQTETVCFCVVSMRDLRKKSALGTIPSVLVLDPLCATFTILDIDIVNIHRRHQQLWFFLDRPEVVVVAPRW
jgi:hypothetical protein